MSNRRIQGLAVILVSLPVLAVQLLVEAVTR